MKTLAAMVLTVALVMVLDYWWLNGESYECFNGLSGLIRLKLSHRNTLNLHKYPMRYYMANHKHYDVMLRVDNHSLSISQGADGYK